MAFADPILLEVLRNRLDAIADEMEITILKSAYSPIVKEGLDASSALFDVKGETIAQGTGIPIHLGSLVFAVRRILEVFRPETMREGDAFLLNDPYDGGTHLPDWVVVIPIVWEGRAVALATTMCHHQDVGGKTPGSIPTDATEIYQEGLIIPPCRLMRGNEPDPTVLAFIRRNVRIPDVVVGDLMAQIAAGRLGVARMQELFAKQGVATVLAAIEELFARAEVMTRRQIAAIPDGTYRFADHLDNDGIDLDRRVEIRVAVTIRGSDVTFDFTGTSPQVRGPFNSVPSSTLSAVYYVIRAVTDPRIPNNAGCFRPVSVVLPEGSLVNPNPPAPVSGRTATIKRIADTLLGAFVKALPDRMPAANSGTLLVMAIGGTRPETGRPFVAAELAAGGMGARPRKDGLDAVETDVTNCMNIPVEALEMNFPVRVPYCRTRRDSGGAGRYRGGLGLEKAFYAVSTDLTVSHRGERFYTVPWGLLGGLPGAGGEAVVERADGGRETVPGKQMLTLRPGDTLHVRLAGGAGHGDPLEREEERVLEDVLDGKVSAEAARRDYGVVLDAAGREVDALATKARREALRAERGAIRWTYDRGPAGRE
ncbi:MAG: hydantoinase B/oxoprolinase family protein [Candidatus Rokubacteria bacterium]|nr:hydantoinase B/oxoprolinase family protein [Candidatus Rokubacteria bacterium]